MLEKRGLNTGKPGSVDFGLGGQMLGPSWPSSSEGEIAAFFLLKNLALKTTCVSMFSGKVKAFHVFQDGYMGNRFSLCV